MDQVDRQFEFHRLARSSPAYRWWTPLLTALLGVAFYLIFTVVVLLLGAVIALATSADVEQLLAAAAAMDLGDPVVFAFTLVSLIILIPALGLATLIVGPKPVGLLSSVAGRIRWRWLAVCTVAAAAVFVASLAVSLVLGFFFPEETAAAPVRHDTSTLVLLLALSVLAVPFQAAAEEYVFRGFLMQAIGGWLRHPAFAILLPVPLFVVAHGYDPLGQTSIAIFAIITGWISWRTGGLEAAIAMHTVNNMTIFVLGAFGLADVNSTEGSVGGLIVSAATLGTTAAIIVRLADRRGIDRTRTAAPRPASPLLAYPPSTTGHPGHSSGAPWTGSRPQGAYDPTPYAWSPSDPSRYDTPYRSAVRQAAVPPAPASPPPTPPAPRPNPTPEPTPDPFGRPAPHGGVPAQAASFGTWDYGTDRHPTGPAHPPGPGYPSGTPYPSGPGYPGAVPSPGAPHPEQDGAA